MGIFARLFGNSNCQSVEILEASITQLRVGVFARLSKEYITVYGKQNGEFLSAAILNEALLESPGNHDGELYRNENASLIERESLQLASDPEIASALSYLYAAQTIYLVFVTKEPLSKRAQELGEQATRLSISIPNTYDICGSSDVRECILAIREYATKFVEESNRNPA
jgi:hypothetical protein